MSLAAALPAARYDQGVHPARRAAARFFANRWACASLLFLALLLIAAFPGLALSGIDPNKPDYTAIQQSPSWQKPFGTDILGRDMVARVLAGARISLQIALLAGLINLTIGTAVGAAAGYAGGRTDDILMRLVDLLYGIPTILVVILLMVWLGQGLQNIYLAIGLTYWIGMARIVRGEVLSLRQRDFVQAARASGAGPVRIVLSHILPNCIGVILVTLTLFLPEAIFIEAFLSYIGLGVAAPDSSWGTLAAEGAHNLRSAPHLLVFPAAALCITMLALNIAGDALRDAVMDE